MAGLFTELRRRNVFKVAIVYAVVAWLVAQVVSVIQEPLHLPPWFTTAVIVLLIIGFPFAVILAWAFELTPQGIKRTEGKEEAGSLASEPGSEPVPALPADTGIDEDSIAVLPFVDMSPEKDQEYFSDGISEELLNQLAKVRGLHVAGRTSSFHFKGHTGDIADIAAKLRVAHVLEGSVRKAGNRVRVTAQLIKADDGYHLWSETYDRELDDIFAIQEDIARAVTDALSITLGVGELKVGTRNVAAYDAFLAARARYHSGGPEDWEAAVDMMRKATQMDPEFLDAQVMLANIANNALNAASSERSDEYLRTLEDAVEHSVALAPDAPSVLCVRGLRERLKGRLVEAGRLFEESARKAPNDSVVLQSLGDFLGEVGRIQDAISVFRQWVRVEPLYVQPTYIFGMALETAGELDQAEEQYRLAGQLEGNPNAFAGPELVIAMTRKDRAAILSRIEQVLQDDLGVVGHRAVTAGMRDHLDDPEAALALLRQTLEREERLGALMRTVIALWAAYFGDTRLALETFDDIRDMPANFIWVVIWRPLFRDMRQLPEFKELLKDLGLVDYWRETGHWGDYVRPVGDDDFEVIG